jgi:hypothetical protein
VHWIHLAQAFLDVMLWCWDEGTTDFPNLKMYTINNTASHARRPGPSDSVQGRTFLDILNNCQKTE